MLGKKTGKRVLWLEDDHGGVMSIKEMTDMGAWVVLALGICR